MKMQPVVILPVAAALASMGSASAATASTSEPAQNALPQDDAKSMTSKAHPDLVFQAGTEFLGLTVMQQADGAVVAQHHSHHSHSSHHSHHSSRY